MNTKPKSLPSSWKLVRLDQTSRIVGGSTPKTDNSEFWDGRVAWATPKDLSDLDTPYLEDSSRKITELGLQSCGAEILPAGSVLFSSRAPIGLVAINRIPMATNQGFKSFIPNKTITDFKYLFHWLKANRTYLDSLGNGATFKEVSKAIVSRIEIPLPPTIDEQKRLAAILDQADAIRRKRQQALRLTDDFLRSVFLDFFGDPSTNSKGWEMGTIGNLLQSVNYGTSQKAHPEPDGVPVLRMNNITYSGGWDFTSLKYTIFNEKDREKYLVHNGEMLFNRTNSRELVGKTAVFRLKEPMAYAGYLVRAVPKAATDIEFVAAYLNSEHGKKTLINMCKSIVGMANINAQEMRSIPIPLPPCSLQKKFGDIVRAVESRRELHRKAIAEAETLFKSLQHCAFTGQL